MTTPTVANIPEGSDALAGCFLAADYYGGMMTALYALASAGNLELYPGEGPARIRNELGEAIAAAEGPAGRFLDRHTDEREAFVVAVRGALND